MFRQSGIGGERDPRWHAFYPVGKSALLEARGVNDGSRDDDDGLPWRATRKMASSDMAKLGKSQQREDIIS